MENSKKTLEFKFERTIPASLGDVFDAWLNPKIPAIPGMQPKSLCRTRK